MIPQIEQVWRLTRNLPPGQQQVVNLLFSEIEHVHQQEEILKEPQSAQLELKFNHRQPNYYEPKWFSNSNGKIQ